MATGLVMDSRFVCHFPALKGCADNRHHHITAHLQIYSGGCAAVFEFLRTRTSAVVVHHGQTWPPLPAEAKILNTKEKSL